MPGESQQVNKVSDGFSTKLRAFRASRDLSQQELATLLNITRSYLSELENGRPPSQKLEAKFELVSHATEIGPQDDDEILDDADLKRTIRARWFPPEGRVREVSVLSWAQAGQMIDFEELPPDWRETIPTDCPDPKAFAVELRGDSMEPRFVDGEIVILMPSFKPRQHSLVVARIEGQGVIFKVFSFSAPKNHGEEATMRFTSYNPAFPPIEVAESLVSWCYPVHSLVRRIWH